MEVQGFHWTAKCEENPLRVTRIRTVHWKPPYIWCIVMSTEQNAKLNLTFAGHARVRFVFFMEPDMIESGIELSDNHMKRLGISLDK